MRPAVIMRVATLAVLALLAAGAVPARSSTSSVAGHGGISLRRVSMKPGAAVRHEATRPAPLHVADPVAYRREKAAADAGYRRWLREHPAVAAASRDSVRRPTGVSGNLNHAGLAATDQEDSVTPPDTTGSVGPDNYVEMVNSTLAVYSKTDLSAPTETMDEASFSGAPNDPACDGNIEWDQAAGRWLYSIATPCEFAGSHHGVAFGWSKTSSPSLTASNWCQYAIDTGAPIPDYPKLGHDDSQILIGVNQFGPGDVSAKVFVLDKPANGDTTCPDSATELSTSAVLTVGSLSTGGAWTPVAANLADSSPVGYVTAIDFDRRHVHLYTVGRNISNANVLLDSQTFAVPRFCVPARVPQKGAATFLDSQDTRMTQAVAVTDPSTGHEGIWTQHTVAASCKRGRARGPSVVRWYELAPDTSTPTQMGTVGGPNGSFAFMGAISPSADGQNAAIFYNSGSKTRLPDFRVRDRHRYTTGGSMVEDLLLATSTSPDKDRSCAFGTCRWGDYNAASPDPSDATLIWGTGELTVAPPHKTTHAPQWGSENAAIDVTPAANYGLDVKVADTRAGTGSVSSSPDGIALCIATCSHIYAYNTPVQLTATPGPHSVFHWSGDCSGSGACNVPMGGPETVTATFVPEPETLSYRRQGHGLGTVTSSPTGLKCKSRCSVPFDYGTRVRMTATAAPGSVFRGWSGACTGHRTCRVTMDDAQSVRAKFVKLKR